MHSLIRKIDKFDDVIGRSAAWLALVMVLLMGLIVLLRYVFQIGSIALQESVIYLNALIFTLGAAYTLKEQGHVRVDVFNNRFSPKTQQIVEILGIVLFLFVTCGFVIWASWEYVSVSWRIREGSAESSGLPIVYLLKSSLIALPLLLALQGVSELLKAIASLLDQPSVPDSHA